MRRKRSGELLLQQLEVKKSKELLQPQLEEKERDKRGISSFDYLDPWVAFLEDSCCFLVLCLLSFLCLESNLFVDDCV